MKSLKVVFMGSPEFAVPSLEALQASRHQILAVVSGSDKRRRRGGRPEPTDVKRRALELGLSVLEVDDPKSEEAFELLSALNADLFVVVAFKILPPRLLALPAIGSVNLHASLLPKYRGAAPIHRAVMEGAEETGCTIFMLDERVDTGNVLARHREPVGPDETTGDVYDRLKRAGANLLVETLDALADGSLQPEPQNDSEATQAPKLFRENTRIDFHLPAEQVHNFVRGLQPFPVAWCMYGDAKMNVHRTRRMESIGIEEERTKLGATGKPGGLHADGGRLLVECGDGMLEILRLQLPGTKKMTGREFINGYGTDKLLH